MIFIGIDPGLSGGIAFVADRADWTPQTFKMPATERDLLDVFERVAPRGASVVDCHAVIERVNPGVFGALKSGGRMGVVSAFTFGKGYGALLMALTAARIPFDQVTPLKWQQALQCQTHGDKNISKRRAQQLFPSLKITHATADALLLAEFCRRTRRGLLHEETLNGEAIEIKNQRLDLVLDALEGRGPSKTQRPAQSGSPRLGTGPIQTARQPLRSDQ